MLQSSYPARAVEEDDPDELDGTKVDWEPMLRTTGGCGGDEEGKAGRGLELDEYAGVLTLDGK